MKYFIFMFFLGCTQDISIMKRITGDTSDNDNQNTVIDSSSDNEIEIDDEYENNLTVGFIEYSLIQASCPSCFGLQSEILTKQYARFHQPSGGSHYEWVPREDETCREYYDSNFAIPNNDIGNTIVLKNSNFELYLNKNYDDTGVIYSSVAQNTDTNYLRDVEYYAEIDGNRLSEDRIQSLHGFDYIEPYEMLYVDPSYAYQAPINKYSNTFNWSPYGDQNSFFTIHVSVYSWDGSSYYGTVICRGDDTGHMTIPGEYFTNYPQGSLTSIHMMRHRIKDLYSEKLQGIIQTHVWWEVIGTGYIQ